MVNVPWDHERDRPMGGEAAASLPDAEAGESEAVAWISPADLEMLIRVRKRGRFGAANVISSEAPYRTVALVPAPTLAAEREKTAAAQAERQDMRVRCAELEGQLRAAIELRDSYARDGSRWLRAKNAAEERAEAAEATLAAERTAHEETRRKLVRKEADLVDAHRTARMQIGRREAAEARIRSLEERLATAGDAMRRNYEGWRNAIELGLLPDQYVGEVRGLAELCWNTLASLHNPPQQPGVTHGDASQDGGADHG